MPPLIFRIEILFWLVFGAGSLLQWPLLEGAGLNPSGGCGVSRRCQSLASAAICVELRGRLGRGRGVGRCLDQSDSLQQRLQQRGRTIANSGEP